MWQGKPVSEWTEEEKNHFLTLLIGECWHEGIHPEGLQFCTKCEKLFAGNTDFFSSLSGFDRIRKYMEKELPEVWEKYLMEKWYKSAGRGDTYCLNTILNLDNLLSFLLSNTEGWGITGCNETSVCTRDRIYCLQCEMVVKHPALLFVEGVK